MVTQLVPSRMPNEQLYCGIALLDDTKQNLERAKSVLHPPKLILHDG